MSTSPKEYNAELGVFRGSFFKIKFPSIKIKFLVEGLITLVIPTPPL